MSGRSGLLQRKCACGASGAKQHSECEDCKKKKSSVQRRALGKGPSTAPPIVYEVLRSAGQPLDSGARNLLGPRLGHSFSNVRVHTDSRAAASARAVDAAAYTVGDNVVFDSGQYSPQTVRGHQLLAHELTHVVQQSGSTHSGTLTVDSANSEAEREAERAEPQASALPSMRVQRTLGGALAGGLIGGVAGAAIGSLFGPIGTVLGGLVGAIGGALLGDLGSTKSRKLKTTEIAQAKDIFKDSINYSKIEITRDSVFASGAPRTIGNTIHLKSTKPWLHFEGDTLDLTPVGEETLIHEMTHVWQYQNGGLAYLPQSLIAQIKASVSTGDRGAAYRWRDAVAKNLPWEKWNPEQQAKMVEDYNKSLRAVNNHTATAEDYQTVADAQPYIEKLQNREGAPQFFGSSKGTKTVQKKSRGGAGEVSGSPAPPIVHDVLRTPGRPLDAATRGFMETRFGQDFSCVRLHTGGQAAQSARAVNALAYTVGSDIVVDASHLDPHLLAHELAHVAQNSRRTDSSPGGLMIGSVHDPAERDAERAADQVMGGGPRPISTHRETQNHLRRQQNDEPKKDPKPWLGSGDWTFNPALTVPKLGTGSLEDLHKGWEAIHGSSGEKKQSKCPPGWRFLPAGDTEGQCCKGYSIDDKDCCSPKALIKRPLDWACPDTADTPKADTLARPPGEINKDFKVTLPPLPSLTITRPVHFNQDQPTSAVASESALRSSLTAGGKSDLTMLIDSLVKFPTFGVQLTGMASVEGPPAHNLQLGEARARSVANVLIARGIAPYRISEPVGAAADCPALSIGIHNCGDSQASKTLNPDDRQVRARLFVMPEPVTIKP